MNETLEAIIADKKKSGMSQIQITKWLNDNGYSVSNVEVRIIFLKV